MQLSEFIKKNFKPLVFLGTIILILFLLGAVFYINSSNKSKNGSFVPTYSGSKYAGYNKLKQEINSLIDADKTNFTKTYKARFYGRLLILEDKKATTDQAYKSVSEMSTFMSAVYSTSHNATQMKAIQDMGTFAKTNFPKQYNKNDFFSFCADTACADEPQPPEISKIIEGVNKSDFPNGVKLSVIQNIENAGYLTKNNRDHKFLFYYNIVGELKSYSDFSPSGQNLTLANELQTFINNKYSQEQKEFLSKTKPK